MIRILTDSACDILPAEAQQLGVTVIPLNVTLEDGTVLRDGIDMTPSEYYTHLAACRKLPTTSQPSPEQFERLYLDAAAAGDEVLGIFLSDALSGTGQCARLAADLANVDNVVFVNTENVCLGQSLLVRLAVQLRDAGKTITQIAADLEKAKQHLHLVAAVDNLKYLRKGGRLSAAAAVAGGMLGIKPILAVMEGKVALAGKARGLPGVYVALFKKIDEMGGIHPGYTPLLGYTVNHRELQPLLGYTVNHRELQPLLTYLQDNLHLDAPLVRQIGCVIGTHTGPGAFGIAFFDKELALE
ncbi:DegV family protein [Faecalibacterium prausnitzii]|uniref:DegV family protein n=1 Tax=Faecalibacterium prausnitzii TaxID=853 RepID=UPI00101F0DC3|nr:DegV family protein [Faecalibacterium prausnitzii]MSC64529.1 DegV family EDD domain-containing protein [Faecalibacterium prausnitzii]MSC71574.1 DegV family EDD domain-containing protein [Faecalibacterium prausnitzii]MSC95789.1 DegV family EDD domain-containing protein [Faecalibacterium prausnitzii]MSD38559.1 DegV family EDD domain-containing protein [Faecalibacterium prausnitzii]MSD50158.1 DegV family EDD domain-containing protein [Faecalibacterium prausnitzii]